MDAPGAEQREEQLPGRDRVGAGIGVDLMPMNRVNAGMLALALVRDAQRLITADTPWAEAADQIESKAAGDRESLQEAVLHWLNIMRRRPSDDFAAGRVLRALERALASTPRPHPAT